MEETQPFPSAVGHSQRPHPRVAWAVLLRVTVTQGGRWSHPPSSITVMSGRDSPCWAPVGVELKDNIPLGGNLPRFPVRLLCVTVVEEVRGRVRRSGEESWVTSSRVTVSTRWFQFSEPWLPLLSNGDKNTHVTGPLGV